MPQDRITVLRCEEGKRMCKLVREDGEVVGYDSAYLFDGYEVAVTSACDLSKLVERLIRQPRCCVVRGVLRNPAPVKNMRRLLYADPKNGDPATLDDEPHSWVALDMEGIALPEGVAFADLPACAERAIELLPAAFHNAQCAVQASASHGIKDGIRLRLWFWLSRPTSGEELKLWLKDTPADAAVFRAAQPIYTAAPIFENSAQDPVPLRVMLLPGEEAVEVPSVEALTPPPRPEYKPVPMPTDTRARKYASNALTSAAIRIATAAINSRHETALNEARGLGRLVKAGLLTSNQVSEMIQGAIEQAGKPRSEGALVAAWGMAHPSASAVPAVVG